MFKQKNFYFHVMILFLALMSLSCTRSMDLKSVNVSFSSKLGSFSNFTLSTVFISIQIPGNATISRKYQYNDNSGVAQGGVFQLVVEDVPQVDGILVQFLGVFEDNTGVMNLSYGDQVVDIGVNREANITANSAGTVTGQGQVAGKLLASTPKSGRMTAYYIPQSGKPAMAVDTSDIVNGWFNIFVLDGGSGNALTYKLDDGTVVFNNIYMSSGALYINGSSVSPSTYLLKVNYPTTYRQNYSSGVPSGVKARPQTTFYYGFLNGGTAPSTQKVCYPQNNESIIGIYGDSSLANYVQFKYTGAGAGEVGIGTSSGASESLDGYYIVNTGTCDKSNAGHLHFFPQMAKEGMEAAGIVRPPFRAVQPQNMGSEWLQTSSTTSGGNTTYTFTWDYLAGITTSHVTGTDILKFNSSSFSGGGDTTCETLLNNGYIVANNVTGVTATANVTVPTSSSWSFAICPYLTTGGVKTYYKEFLFSGCVGQCNPFHFGWSAASAVTVASGATAFSSSPINGKSSRITAINSASYPAYTEVTLGIGTTGFSAGDEVMLAVSGAGTSTDCGTSINVGKTDFARVLGTGSGTYLYLPKGTIADNISTTYINAAANSANFCYLQAIRVPQFTDLTINTSGQIVADTFAYDNYGGGVVAMRVNGILTSSGTIKANGVGYPGGNSTYKHGAGARSDRYSSTFAAGLGGEGVSSGNAAGGAGAESGATGGGTTAPATGGTNSLSYSYINSLFGGGGGKGSSSDSGGAGGGSVFVTARKLSVSSSAYIQVNGSGSSSGYGGGGGGGTVTLVAKEATGSGLYLSATGASPSSGGGGGGGGYIRAYFCNNDGVTVSGEMTLTSSNIYTTAGTGGSGSAAGTTFSSAYPSISSGSNYYFCNQ